MSSDKLRKTYNKIAQDFADEHYTDDWDNDYRELFVKTMSKGTKVLDLGCGAGNDTAELNNSGLKAEGLDLSDKLIEIAKKLNPKPKFTQGDMLDLPYQSSSFDGVFAKASLLHIPKKDVPKALTEINRVLKPNGLVHIAVKGGEGEGEINENDYGYEYSRFFSYWKMEPFIELLEKHGFKIAKQEVWRRTPASYTTWLKIIARKT